MDTKPLDLELELGIETIEVLELQYTRAKIKTQVSARWLNRKMCQVARLNDKIRTVKIHAKESEREMLTLEMQIIETKGNIKKITTKPKKEQTLSAEQAKSFLNGLTTKQRDEFLAKLR